MHYAYVFHEALDGCEFHGRLRTWLIPYSKLQNIDANNRKTINLIRRCILRLISDYTLLGLS